jgi:KDO2-lipid IV(A) lauroyltransferase
MEMGGIRAIETATRLLPWPAALACARSVGRLAWRLGVRRSVCEENVARALADTTDTAERRRIAIGAYENLGILALEFFRLLHLSAAQRRDLLEFEGLEIFQQILEEGRGAIAVTGHYGNWEILGACAVAHGLPVSVVVQRLRNRRLDAFLWQSREALGMRILERGMALRGVGEHLRANRLVGFLSDQDARRRGCFVPFFGIPASTPKGAAQMALRHRVPLVPFFGLRLPDGRHRMIVHAPLEPPVGADEEQAVADLMTRFNGLLEQTIRREPSQYLWLHRRWKSRPESTVPLSSQAG